MAAFGKNRLTYRRVLSTVVRVRANEGPSIQSTPPDSCRKNPAAAASSSILVDEVCKFVSSHFHITVRYEFRPTLLCGKIDQAHFGNAYALQLSRALQPYSALPLCPSTFFTKPCQSVSCCSHVQLQGGALTAEGHSVAVITFGLIHNAATETTKTRSDLHLRL